jgi:hypothetical protein
MERIKLKSAYVKLKTVLMRELHWRGLRVIPKRPLQRGFERSEGKLETLTVMSSQRLWG